MFKENHFLMTIRFLMAVSVVVGNFGVLPFQTNESVYALGNLPGTLDLSFDTDGIVITDFSANTDMGRATLIQEDGKVVVAGSSYNGENFDFGLARYNVDGSLDTTFDTDGKVTTDFVSYLGSNNDHIYAVAYQNWNGKIVVVGATEDQVGSSFAIARYNNDGSLDTGFGEDGRVTAGGASAHSVAIQSDGKIVVAGTSDNIFSLALVRFNENGSLDTTFGINGKVDTDFHGTGASGGYIALLPNEKILLVGTRSQYYQKTDFVMARYNNDGSLDATFSGGGKVITDVFSDDAFANSVTIQSDGKILIAGSSHISGESYGVLARFNPDGLLDTDFGIDGRVITGRSGIYRSVVAIQPNKKIVVGGYYWDETDDDFSLLRYNFDGSLDTTFGVNGEVTTELGETDQAFSIAIQPNGRILIAGFTDAIGGSYDFAVVRYFGDEIHYVNWQATGANDGSSWTDAYTDLQSALSAASSGDEIWVAAGTYKPTSGADRTISFALKNGVAVYGGFAGTETLLSERDWKTNVTVLSGDLNGNDNNNIDTTEPTRADNSYHVVIGSNTENSALLDGFYVSDGNANEGDHIRGGGMYNYKGNPSVNNVIFSSNTALFGGGVSNYEDPTPYPVGSNPILTDVSFIGNSAVEGGGMHNAEFSSPILTNVTFENNTASRGGGGIENINYCDPVLTNVAFINNTAGAGGGMMNWNNNNPSLTNVTFYGNTAYWEVEGDVGGDGGALYNHLGTPLLTNVTINENSAFSYGGGIYNNNSNPVIHNVILWGDTASTGPEIYNDTSTPVISDSVIQGGYTGGTNIITADPKLGTLGDYGGFTQTIPLLAGSPAIDAGDDGECPNTDQRGVERPQGSHCDIGAYEYDGPTYTVLQSNFSSVGSYDGWILESSETSNNGGTMNSSSDILYLGDDAQNKQYRAILHFDTSSLPDNAVIVDAKLRLSTNEVVTGVNPFTTHDKIVIELNTGAYSTSSNLQLEDFKIPSDRNGAGAVQNNLVNGFYRGRIKGAGLEYFDLGGVTQVRLRFKTDDDDDSIADLLEFFSGNASASADRPRLVIYYYIP